MDKKIKELINKETLRQQFHIELIASENFASEDILKITGSILTNKYSEGYPGKRYYGGCEYIDELETIAINKAKELFQAEHANVQPHSGSQANAAVYQALLNPGDTILGMSLDSGGHLTHGYKINFSGKFYNTHFYGVNKDTEELDYNEIALLAKKIKPKLIIAGASSYSKIIDFAKFREIADSVNALLHVDMAHIAGLVAVGLHPSPFPFADVVTSTTHKTLRGPRGGIILCKAKFAKKIDSAVFPGTQGGPLEHVIAAKAQAFIDALQPDFLTYQKQVIKNMQVLAEELIKKGFRIVARGTENHLLTIDVKDSLNITGAQAEQILADIGIVCNKNLIPFDKEKPMHTSGIRVGSPAMTTRGFKEKEFIRIAEIINFILRDPSEVNKQKISQEIKEWLKEFPI